MVKRRAEAVKNVHDAVSLLPPPEDMPDFTNVRSKLGDYLSLDINRMPKDLFLHLKQMDRRGNRWTGKPAAKEAKRYLEKRGLYEKLVAYCGDEKKAMQFLIRK